MNTLLKKSEDVLSKKRKVLMSFEGMTYDMEQALVSSANISESFYPNYELRLCAECWGNILPEDWFTVSVSLPTLAKNIQALDRFDLLIIEFRDCYPGRQVYPRLSHFNGSIIFIDTGWIMAVGEHEDQYLKDLKLILDKTNLVIKWSANPVQPYLEAWNIKVPICENYGYPISDKWLNKSWGHNKTDKIAIMNTHQDKDCTVLACVQYLNKRGYVIDIIGGEIDFAASSKINFRDYIPSEHFTESIYSYKILIDPHNTRTPVGRFAEDAALAETIAICPISPVQQFLFPDFEYDYKNLNYLANQVKNAFNNYDKIISKARTRLEHYTISQMKKDLEVYYGNRIN